MKKEYVIKVLIGLRKENNKKEIDKLINKIDNMSYEELNILLEQKNIFEDNIEEYLEKLIEKTIVPEENSEKFISVNDWFCYGRTGDTIHVHITPPDLRGVKKELGDEGFYKYFKDQLEDFLSRMQEVFLDDTSINTLFAVSPIFYNDNITWAFETLGFDKLKEVDINNKDDNMSEEQKERFINMFNKGEKKKKVFYTKMSRDKFLSMEYSQIKDGGKYKKI